MYKNVRASLNILNIYIYNCCIYIYIALKIVDVCIICFYTDDSVHMFDFRHELYVYLYQSTAYGVCRHVYYRMHVNIYIRT